MIPPPQGNQPLLLDELMRWNPWPPYDPVPWIFSQLEEAVRTELVIARLEMHKEILAAQIKAADHAIGAISKRTQAKP